MALPQCTLNSRVAILSTAFPQHKRSSLVLVSSGLATFTTVTSTVVKAFNEFLACKQLPRAVFPMGGKGRTPLLILSAQEMPQKAPPRHQTSARAGVSSEDPTSVGQGSIAAPGQRGQVTDPSCYQRARSAAAGQSPGAAPPHRGTGGSGAVTRD